MSCSNAQSLQEPPIAPDQAIVKATSLASEGTQLLRANKNEAAAEKLKEALVMAPLMAEWRYNLSLALAKLGNMPDAITQLKQACQQKPTLDAGWMTLGGLYQSNGDLTEAIFTYQEFINRFPNHAMVPRVKGLIEALSKEKEIKDRQLEQDQALNAELGQTKGPGGNDDYLFEIMRGQPAVRWPAKKMPLRIFVPSAPGLSGFRDSYRAILLKSFQDWSAASGNLLAFKVVDKAADADIVCYWTDKVADLHGPSEAGDARVSADQDGICHVDIWFLTRGLKDGERLSDNAFRLISLHEIGHSLGLTGHTTNPKDIMFFSVSFQDTWRDLSPRDQRTIIRLYRHQ